jgi:hypothetical protein
MTDTYVYLIREEDWDSDRALPEANPSPELVGEMFGPHQAFQQAVADLGARIVGGDALQDASKYGGVVTPGAEGRQLQDAVYTDSPYADSSELITGFYAVEVDDEDTARRIAALVPTGGTIEWRKVFPTGS